MKCETEQPFTHCLYHDRNIYMTCEAHQLSALLSTRQMKLLEAIDNAADRIDVFKTNLRWGIGLKAGSNVLVTLPGKDIEAKGIVRHCAEVKGSCLFGVEILVCN